MAEAAGLIKGAAGLIKDFSLISSLVGSARDKIISCRQNGLGSLLGDGDDLKKIKSSLNTMYPVIESAEEHPLKDQALVDWLQQLKDAAYDADDVLDEYATQDLTNKVRKIASWISPVLIYTNMTLKLKLKEIRKRLESIEEESHKFQLSERVIKWDREFKEQRQTHSPVDEPEVYGRDEEKEKIVNLVLHPVAGNEDEKVSVIPIVGMGGVGKTTLAQLVFNDDRVHNHFEPKMWVCVSDDFHVGRLINTITSCVTLGYLSASKHLKLEELRRRLQEALNGRRYLLVLDDVWNENPNKWRALRDLLKCGGRGSRIVVTTRSPKIASIMSKIEPHHLEGLSEGNCWKLFASRAFPDDREGDHPNLVDIGKDIVKKCGGVPLAVITMGSLLSLRRLRREESEWVFVRDSELWNLAAEDVHGILPALRLSYYYLNPQLRQCFAFCAIFPKDYKIDKELLMQLWMAHGCVPSRRGMELEDISIEILNELLMSSLFQEVEDDDDGGGSLKIKVHDLVHDLAQSVMENHCCIIESGKSGSFTKKVRHLYYCSFGSIKTVPDFLNETHESLRTFLVPNGFCFDVPQDMAIFKFLRVLHLAGASDELLLPTSLGKLIHLRYLGLPNNGMETLPESISNLQNLRTLNLSGSFRLRELPKGTGNLINLRCLDLRLGNQLSHMPAKIGMLSCLRKLPLFVVGDGTGVCSGIEELQCLNQLKGNLKIKHLERVAIPSNAQQADLIRKPNLDILQLCWHHDTGDGIKIESEEEVLNGLQPHKNLKELEIEGYGGIHFPGWMTGFFPSLKILEISHCINLKSLPEGIGNLSSLEMFSLKNVGLTSLPESMKELSTLRCLSIMSCPRLPSLPEWVENLTALQHLTIASCPQMVSLPRLQHLTGLQSLDLIECPKMQRRCRKGRKDFHKIRHIPKVKFER